MNEAEHLDELTRGLARHLRINPLACDTLEGIAQWWSISNYLDFTLLSTALLRLERGGVLEKLHATDGRVRYRRTAMTAAIDMQLDRFIAGQF